MFAPLPPRVRKVTATQTAGFRRSNEILWNGMLLCAGILLGAVLAWGVFRVIPPPSPTADFSPRSLQAMDQRDAVILIAQTFLQQPDLEQTTTWLGWFGWDDPTKQVEEMLRQMPSQGVSEAQQDAVANLLRALRAGDSP